MWLSFFVMCILHFIFSCTSTSSCVICIIHFYHSASFSQDIPFDHKSNLKCVFGRYKLFTFSLVFLLEMVLLQMVRTSKNNILHSTIFRHLLWLDMKYLTYKETNITTMKGFRWKNCHFKGTYCINYHLLLFFSTFLSRQYYYSFLAHNLNRNRRCNLSLNFLSLLKF